MVQCSQQPFHHASCRPPGQWGQGEGGLHKGDHQDLSNPKCVFPLVLSPVERLLEVTSTLSELTARGLEHLGTGRAALLGFLHGHGCLDLLVEGRPPCPATVAGPLHP